MRQASDHSCGSANTNNAVVASLETTEQTLKPARHPILDRLENNDYDFNGQSLDYEPNLEFDDTDLKQEIEEELEQLNANLMFNLNRMSTTTNSDTPNQMSSSNADLNQQQQQQQENNEAAPHGSPDHQQDSDLFSDNDIFIEHLKSQLYLQQQASSPAYLESPHDLLEENFEEAFKSSLFELENEEQRNNSSYLLSSSRNHTGARMSALMNSKSNNRSATSKSGGKLNSFLKSATSGFYVNKQNLLNDSLDELKLDDDFENDDFSDIAKHNCVEVAGDDLFGRKIITIYACRLPSETKIHHNRLLKYIMYTLDQYVENDYCVVYFHYGLNSQNKPKLNFLYQAYKAFDRKYKKNLKALFLVHPTNFIRIVWQLFKPIIR